MNTGSTMLTQPAERGNITDCLYRFQEVLPGLTAMILIAVFSNNLMGVPNPFTLENLFAYLDRVIGPINGQPFFQILNSNFVWNAFLAGFLIANIFGVPNCWKRGLSYIHILMPLGIIMLAPHFIMGHAAKAGGVIFALALGLLLITATITMLLGRLFRVENRHAADIAGALSTGDPHVCAILMPMIKAKGGQVMNATAGVIFAGALAAMLFPFLIQLFGLNGPAAGLAAVLGVGNGAAAHTAAFGVSYEAGRYSAYYDVVRHVLVPAGFLYVFLFCVVSQIRKSGSMAEVVKGSLRRVPLFVLVFIGLWFLACLHVFKEPAHQIVFELVRWDFSLAAAALGLSVSWRDIVACGMRGFLLTCTVCIIRFAVLFSTIVLLKRIGLLPF